MILAGVRRGMLTMADTKKKIEKNKKINILNKNIKKTK